MEVDWLNGDLLGELRQDVMEEAVDDSNYLLALILVALRGQVNEEVVPHVISALDVLGELKNSCDVVLLLESVDEPVRMIDLVVNELSGVGTIEESSAH